MEQVTVTACVSALILAIGAAFAMCAFHAAGKFNYNSNFVTEVVVLSSIFCSLLCCLGLVGCFYSLRQCISGAHSPLPKALPDGALLDKGKQRLPNCESTSVGTSSNLTKVAAFNCDAANAHMPSSSILKNQGYQRASHASAGGSGVAHVSDSYAVIGCGGDAHAPHSYQPRVISVPVLRMPVLRIIGG
ncbi:hypothetical protein [Anaplasma capra]|nr:hypothetical protein [Anaplasma capra]MCU7611984.1 hypothetical protein [Anaplasma capra]